MKFLLPRYRNIDETIDTEIQTEIQTLLALNTLNINYNDNEYDEFYVFSMETGTLISKYG